MLQETLANDPELARQMLRPLVGAVIPIVAGNCATGADSTANRIAKFLNNDCDVTETVAPTFEDSSGMVGIGTAAPTRALHVHGTNAGMLLSGTGTHQVQVTGSDSSGRLGQDLVGFFFASDTNGKALRFLTNNGTLNEWLRIIANGNVGIGTTSPSEKLDVAGNAKFSGFLALAGTTINNSDAVGYVICKTDTTLADKNNEMRGYQATMRYTRTTPDASNVYSRVNTSGTTVTWVAGEKFRTGGVWNGLRIDITDVNGVTTSYVISSVSSDTQLTLTTSAGTQTDVQSAVWDTTKTGGAPGDGWDVFGYGGAVEVKDMALPNRGNVNTSGTAVTWVSGAKFFWASVGQHININGTDYIIASVASVTSLTLLTSAGTQSNVAYADVNIRGQMKPFQSEIYFRAKATNGKNYHVEAPALNYVASLTAVDSTSTVKRWAGIFIDSPCSECGATNAV